VLLSILPECLFVIIIIVIVIIIHAYFIHISQGSIETRLRCGKMYNNHIIGT